MDTDRTLEAFYGLKFFPEFRENEIVIYFDIKMPVYIPKRTHFFSSESMKIWENFKNENEYIFEKINFIRR